MIDNVFIDTNIFLYAKFDDGGEKFLKANHLLNRVVRENTVYISTQVINEFCVNAIRKGGDPDEIHSTAMNFDQILKIIPVTMDTIKAGFRIFHDYQFSHWDCLIISSALETECAVLFTEDLSDGQIIDNKLTIVNPFLH